MQPHDSLNADMGRGAAPPAPPALIPHLYLYLRGNLVLCGVHGDASLWRTLEPMLKAWANSSVKDWKTMLVLACG